MSDTESTTVENETTEVTKVKSNRGRKKLDEGGVHSPREVQVACAAIVDDKLVTELYNAEPGSKEANEAILSAAKAHFMTKYDVTDVKVMGPFIPRKGTQVPKEKKRDSLDLSLETVQLLPGVGAAQYKEWVCSVKLIADNPDAVYVIPKAHINGEKKTIPGGRFVKKDSLINLAMNT